MLVGMGLLCRNGRRWDLALFCNESLKILLALALASSLPSIPLCPDIQQTLMSSLHILFSLMDVVCVKSRSSGLKSDRGSGRGMKVSYRGGLEVRQGYEGGDLIRTWHRLMCHALVKVIVLDFRGMEVQRCGDEWGSMKGDFI